jgi:FKBP-type peptidyl-prolyl cis-trans isomerase 2
MKLHIGKRLTITRGAAGPPLRVRVVEIRPDAVIVDGNHPLAGKVIELEVYLISLDSSATTNPSNPQFDIGGEG